MVTKRRVSLGGVELDSLDGRIIVQGVYPQAGKENINTVSIWGGSGSRVTGMHRDYLDVGVKFAISIKKDQFDQRAEVFEKVMAWAAGGGWLTYNGKPNRRLRVIAVTLPAEGDATEWASDYQITFRAYGVPYWQNSIASTQTANNVTTATYSIGVDGNAPTVMDLNFENTSGGVINAFKVTAGNSVFEFEDLGLQSGETMVIDHNDNGKRSVLRIRIRNLSGKYRSALEKRSGKSSNDLALEPGTTSVKIESQRKGTLAMSWTGRYM